jgi:ATP-dependent DNA helicase PIF1
MFKQNDEMNSNIVITSTTGTSALLLNGTTLHSFLGIRTGRESIESMVVDIQKKPHVSKKWRTVECLVIDEISMLDPDLFDKLEHMARIIRKNTRPFGGIQLVVSGDFLQLPCVGTDMFCFQAESWARCIPETVYLTEIIRQRNITFQTCLNSIRIGIINTEVKDLIMSRVGTTCVNKYNITPTKLYSSNYEVDNINNIELDNLARDERQFYEYTMDINVSPSVKKQFIMEKIKKNCNAQENIQLCVGAQVMLLKNLDLDSGLANGSRGVISKFINDLPMVIFLNGVSRIIDISTWEITENGKSIVTMTQIPLKVAYAISIHKSQGCSLDCIEIDLGNVFEYGQAYVAISRVKSLEGLSIIRVDFDKIRAHPIAVEYYNSIK